MNLYILEANILKMVFGQDEAQRSKGTSRRNEQEITSRKQRY